MRLSLILLLPALLLIGCRAEPNNSADIAISIELANESPAIGEQTFILVTLADSAGNPINDADVNLRGDMNHAGMNPVLGESESSTNGVYEIPFEFTMGGDWIITVDVTLADGSTASSSFNINGVGSETATEEAQNTAVSAAYFTIINNSDADVRLISISAEGVGQATIHQTIVESNIVRMDAVEDGLLIPAGESFELAPIGYHVMLTNLSISLFDGATLALNLSFDNGLSLTVEALIAIDAPQEAGNAEADAIRITGAWLRATTLGYVP